MSTSILRPDSGLNGLERDTGFEPATSTLARLHSTTELVPQFFCFELLTAIIYRPHNSRRKGDPGQRLENVRRSASVPLQAPCLHRAPPQWKAFSNRRH